jgi:hypothetical protein
MTLLDQVLPTPRLVEVDRVEVAAPANDVWALVRHADLGASLPLVRALFAIRTAHERGDGAVVLRLDDLRSSVERPGFQVLVDDPPREVVVGAIGKVWQLDIPFVHVADSAAFLRFAEPGFIKVAWALRVMRRGDRDARIEVEVRVDATDEASWRKFRAYFALIGAGSRFIRRTLLASLVERLGSPDAAEARRPMAGDALLPDARAGMTDGITIHATPERVWPWLVQMGCDRAGYYSIDLLDQKGRRSAREVHPELQDLRVGDVIPATPGSSEGFEVLGIEPNEALVLGGLYDVDAGRQLPFGAERPKRFWHVTWAFELESIGPDATRLRVRARAAFPDAMRLHATWIGPVHALMEAAQLRGLRARVEGALRRDDVRDVLEGLEGAARMVLAFMAPFQRSARSHWGVDELTAARPLPGDALVPEPRWSWTHGVEVDAEADAVWPWLAQVGADKAGFYSYQVLENLAGCDLRNAETIHPEWEVRLGDELLLHPKMPPLSIAAMQRGRWFVAFAPPDDAARASGKAWVASSWLFFIEPLRGGGCRVISRFRAACSDDLATRLAFGPTLLEPIGFAMDRRMLLGIRERAEAAAKTRPLVSFAPSP